MDKTLRNTIITGVAVVSLCAVYYFVIKPEIDKKTYIECRQNFGAKEMVMAPQIQALIDSCVRSGGVKEYYKINRVYLDEGGK